MIRLALLVLLAAILAGCAGLLDTAQPGSSQDLGPASFQSTPAAADVSKELHAGVVWLWQSVARLQDTVDAIAKKAPGVAAVLTTQVATLRADCVDAETAAAGNDADAARAKWRAARAALGRVAAACLSAAAAAGLSQLAASLEGGR